jgi:hypothetical protein
VRELRTLALARWPEPDEPPLVGDDSLDLVLDALFAVRFRIAGDEATVILAGWDRDLTDLVAPATVPWEQADALVGRVAAVLDELRPVLDPLWTPPWRDDDRQAAERRRRLSTTEALRVRHERELGTHREPPPIAVDGLRAVLAERWPDAVQTVGDHGWGRTVALRPYGASEVVVEIPLRGPLAAGVHVGPRLEAPRTPRLVVAGSDVAAARQLIEALDSWLLQTLPPARVRTRPVTHEA